MAVVAELFFVLAFFFFFWPMDVYRYFDLVVVEADETTLEAG